MVGVVERGGRVVAIPAAKRETHRQWLEAVHYEPREPDRHGAHDRRVSRLPTDRDGHAACRHQAHAALCGRRHSHQHD